MFNKAIFLSVVLSSAISLPALAIDSIHVECETCQTDSQFYNAAKKQSILNTSRYVTVMNFENYELKKYKTLKKSSVECEYDKEPDGRGGSSKICRTRYSYSILTASISNQEYNQFTYLSNASNDLRSYISARSVIEVPAIIVGSGYDIIGASYIESRVTNYFNDLPIRETYKEKIAIYLDASTKIMSNGLIVNMPPLVFQFSDGIQAYAKLDFYDADDQAHFKFILIVDSNGNQIDLTKTNPFENKALNFEGIPQSSWSSLYTSLNNLGLGVVGSSSKIVPRGTVTITNVVLCSSGKATLCKSPD